METKETILRTSKPSTILEDVEFYKYIFKKTEKIVCAVFYILRSDTDMRQNDSVVVDVEDTAKYLLDVALNALKDSASYADTHARTIQHALIALESQLRVAHASRRLREGYLEVFLHELDTVQRALRKYLEQDEHNPFITQSNTEAQFRERKVRMEKKTLDSGGEVRASLGGPSAFSRRDRILSIIKDKGEATIKDIASVVTDCSEKTIQRELTNLIKDSIVHRDGERRWSKYKLI